MQDSFQNLTKIIQQFIFNNSNNRAKKTPNRNQNLTKIFQNPAWGGLPDASRTGVAKKIGNEFPVINQSGEVRAPKTAA